MTLPFTCSNGRIETPLSDLAINASRLILVAELGPDCGTLFSLKV
jgi:hypothetical protein